MKKNTFFTLLITFVGMFSSAMAQNEKGMEIGLRVQPSPFALNNAELVLKKQINAHKWHRFSVGDVDAHFFPKSNNQKADIDVSYGRERRWFIVENEAKHRQFALITGEEFTVGSRYVGESSLVFPKRNMQNSSVYVGASAVLGMQYAFCRRFAINAEITPGLDIESVPYLTANDIPARKAQLNLHIWNPRVSVIYRLKS